MRARSKSAGQTLRTMPFRNFQVDGPGQAYDVENRSTARREGLAISESDPSRSRHGSLTGNDFTHHGSTVRKDAQKLSCRPSLDAERLPPAELDDLPDVASLAIDVASDTCLIGQRYHQSRGCKEPGSTGRPTVNSAGEDVDNDASCVQDENIPSLDLGEPLQIWRSFWQAEERDGRRSAAMRPTQADATKKDLLCRRDLQVAQQSRNPTQSREPTTMERGSLSTHLQQESSASSSDQHPGSPRSFLHRSNALRSRSSLSSEEKAEILTASVRRFRRVKFARRAGNGHYVDHDRSINASPQDSNESVVYAREIEIKRRRPQGNNPSGPAIAPRPTFIENTAREPAVKVWDDAVAAADEPFGSERETGNSSTCWNAAGAAAKLPGIGRNSQEPQETVIKHHRILRELPRSDSADRGRRLVTLVNGQLVAREISPIPIDFSRAPRVATPSVHSHGSKSEESSPLLGSIRKTKHWRGREETPRQRLKAASLHMLQREGLSFRERIVKWLRTTTTTDSETRIWSFDQSRKATNNPIGSKKRQGKVFEPEEMRQIQEQEAQAMRNLRRAGKAPAPKKALQDVTNLRQPGYLQHNSFFKESRDSTRAVQPSIRAHIAPQPLEGTSIHSRSVFMQKNLSNPLEQHPSFSEEDIQIAETKKPELSGPAGASRILSPIQSREAALDDALARLEGRR